VGIVILAATLLNPELGQWVAGLLGGTWVAFSRWWALVPLGFLVILFIYGLMQANFEAFQKIESEKEALEKQIATEEQHSALKEVLAEAIREGRKLRESNPTDKEAGAWGGKIKALLVDAFTDSSEAELFVSDQGLLPIWGDETQAQIWLGRRLERLENLIQRSDSLQIRPGFNGRAYIVDD
jgi:hypothetical protein